MTAFLKNLRVNKVSFVKRGANKRPFFLAKSADTPVPHKDGDSACMCKACAGKKKVEKQEEKQEENPGGITTVRKEVKEAIAKILKAGSKKSEVVNLLKADTDLKVTEAETTEISDFMELIPEPVTVAKTEEAPPTNVVKQEDFLKVQNELSELKKANHRAELLKWVETECPNLNLSVTEAADNLMKAEDAGMLDVLKTSYKGTSDALKNNSIFKEYGVSGGDTNSVVDDNIGGGLVGEVRKTVDTLHKSETKLSKSETVVEAIRKMGEKKYVQYRGEHIRRAKLA